MQNGQHLSVAARFGKGRCWRTPPPPRRAAPARGRWQRPTRASRRSRGRAAGRRTGWRSWDRTAALPHRAERNAEQRRHLDGQRRGDGKAQDDERLGACGVRRLVGGVGGDDQLLPQPLGVRACELARQRIQAAHALDRDQEGFVPCQAGLGERHQLVAQMPLELLHVGTMKGGPAAHVRAPLGDLLLERSIGEGRHAVHAFIQMPRRVSSTAFHCCRCAASCARPSLVMR